MAEEKLSRIKENQKQWKRKHRKELSEKQKNYRSELKNRKIKSLGSKCIICGETRINYLTIKNGSVFCYNCKYGRIKNGNDIDN